MQQLLREEDIASDTYVASAVTYYTAFVYMAKLEVLSQVAVSNLWYVQNKAVAVLSGKITCKNELTYVWQSCVDIKGYFITYFDCIAVFEVPYH